ncbi:hypothetical protein DFO61_2338 [Ectopseudomonas oleovorans]|uniref:Uncharacterized protein n=1 Tax=Ectopseudomonas oleovorans TaxID=301 RepID=A0A397ND84_ECTOL|nr:hypothetical protein DFO61_2338 [Pseudomonas oleovorans]
MQNSGKYRVRPICGQQRSYFRRMCTPQITFRIKTDSPYTPPFKLSAASMSYARTDARGLTTGSNRSLRSLGREKARPLTKRYVAGARYG